MRLRGKITFFTKLCLVVFACLILQVIFVGTSRARSVSLEELSENTIRHVITDDLEGFKRGTIELRNELFRRGVLSLNDFADRVYELSENKRPELRRAFIREALRVSPLNVKFWLYLSLSDLISFRIFDFPSDFLNLIYGSLKNPVSLVKTLLIGIGGVSILILAFTFFFALGSFFKYYPNLVADLTTGKALEKIKFFVLPVLVLLFLFLFYSTRAPLFVLFLMLTVFTPYMIHRELVVTIALGVLIFSLTLAFNQVKGLAPVAVTGAGGDVIKVSYGIIPELDELPEEVEYRNFEKLISLRKAFFTGDYHRAAEIARALSSSVSRKFSVYEAMAKYYSGNKLDALSVMKDAYKRYPEDPIIVFNLYQLYLANFQFEKAQELQDVALYGVKKLRPYVINSDEVKEGVLIPAEVGLGLLFSTLESRKGEMKEIPFPAMWRVRSLPTGSAYLVCVFLIILLRIVTFNRYLHSGCKVCGERQPWKVRFKKDDVCGVCASKTHHVRSSIMVPDKILSMRLYRRSTIMRSLLIPGYPLLAVNAVTFFSLGLFVNSFFVSLLLVFNFAFPKEYSPLYDRIYSLGVLVSYVGLVLSYLFFSGFGIAIFRRILKKYRVWEI